MDKSQFDIQNNYIENLRKEAERFRNDYISKLKQLISSSNILLKNLKDRDSKFVEYINLVEEFSFSDTLTSPSDLFPGIRTASEMADPQELADKASKMKNLADEVTAISKLTDGESRGITNQIKQCLNSLTEYVILSNQIYDAQLSLLQDLDSVYDIGSIARNT